MRKARHEFKLYLRRSIILVIRASIPWNSSTISTATTSTTIALHACAVTQYYVVSDGTIQIGAITKSFIASALGEGVPIEID